MSICSLLVVILITMILALSSKLSTVLIVGSSIMAILSAIIAIYLVSSKDLNRYFALQKQASSLN
jgi:asparagine N-glycosylation enzyme membrane subunit Stt3